MNGCGSLSAYTAETEYKNGLLKTMRINLLISKRKTGYIWLPLSNHKYVQLEPALPYLSPFPSFILFGRQRIAGSAWIFNCVLWEVPELTPRWGKDLLPNRTRRSSSTRIRPSQTAITAGYETGPLTDGQRAFQTADSLVKDSNFWKTEDFSNYMA